MRVRHGPDEQQRIRAQEQEQDPERKQKLAEKLEQERKLEREQELERLLQDVIPQSEDELDVPSFLRRQSGTKSRGFFR